MNEEDVWKLTAVSANVPQKLKFILPMIALQIQKGLSLR